MSLAWLKSVRNATTLALVPFCVLLAGCVDGPQSALAPAGEAAADIAWITWIMIAGTLILMLVMSLLGLHAVYRNPEQPVRLSGRSIILWGGLLVPVGVLLVLLVYGVRTGDAMLPVGGEPVDIRVTGHQWWWQFEYTGPDGQTIYTANELHLPAGRPVDIHVASADVIHAFWVPNLGGKVDAIPGRTNTIRLRPTSTGVFRGQCAEFCGAQHAHMAFHVEVHEEEAFDEFLLQLASLDRTGAGDGAGQAIFEQQCAVCHSRTTAEDREGPNLTTLSTRPWLGAGTIENTDEGLRMWIPRHQEIKPGNLMPDHGDLDDEEVEALARYLEAE